MCSCRQKENKTLKEVHEQLWVGRSDAARLFSMSIRKLDDLVKRDVIPSFKVDGRRLFDVQELRQALRDGFRSTGDAA